MRMSVEQPMWRALTVYRVLTACYAVGLFASAYDHFVRPWVAVAYYLLLCGWTLATFRKVANAAACTRRFLAADLGVALVGILITPLADNHERIAGGGPTLPSIWTAGAVLAWAVKGGWRPAAVASTLVALADLAERGTPARDTVHNVVLVWVAAIAIGYVVEVARASERTLARALEIEAATRERERLARDIHDSVLQVLAMVQRRGAVIGGEAAELGRMAGEQEAALRALVSGVPLSAAARGSWGLGGTAGETPSSATGEGAQAAGADGSEGVDGSEAVDGSGGGWAAHAVHPDVDPDAAVDLRSLLAPRAGARVTVAQPGTPVTLPGRAAGELTAAVGAALDNVRQHVGEDARAWILVEDEPDAVIVTVRDDGPGIPPGRLAQAEDEGRMGVALSIRGRLRDLGGTADVVSVPGQGTEVELRVPKAPVKPPGSTTRPEPRSDRTARGKAERR